MMKVLLSLFGLVIFSLAFIFFFQPQSAGVEMDALKADKAGQIDWVWNDLQAGVKKAGEEDKLVLIDFWAGWCMWCVKMDNEVMNSSAVVGMVMKNFVPVKIDTDLSQNNGLISTYRIIGTPAFVVLDGDERIMTQTLGYMSEKEFMSFLERALYREGEVE